MGAAEHIAVIGAGINGLVAANYLQRAGCQVTLLERSHRVGGACVADTAMVDCQSHDYALGASTLGLMQDFVWRETGLADCLQIWAPEHPDRVFFPGDERPTQIYSDTAHAQREFADRWGETGDLAAFRTDLDRVVRYLQSGFRAGTLPSLEDATAELGETLTGLWITGTARDLLGHYLTAERTRVYLAQDVMESGPVSLDEPWSAFLLPIMASGSVMGGDYGFVRGGIWQITQALARINQALGVTLLTDCPVAAADPDQGVVRYRHGSTDQTLHCGHIVFATDPQTAAHLTDDAALLETTGGERVLGTSGKLNLLFRRPVQWKDDTGEPGADAAFRYLFEVDSLEALDAATLAVTDGEDYAPGYSQVYCEGAAMRHMGLNEPFDRLAVFVKNLSLGPTGEDLREVEEAISASVLARIANPEDCAWSRLLTPRDLQQTFGFPGGNIEHTMLVQGQTFADRQYRADPGRRFYQLGRFENASICGAGTWPCGSVAGTPAYLCVQELLRHRAVAA